MSLPVRMAAVAAVALIGFAARAGAAPVTPGGQGVIAPVTVPAPGFGLSDPVASVAKEYGDGVYIVVLDEAPLALYEGQLPGLAPTRPSVTGAARLDVTSAASQRYVDYLDSVQDGFVTALERQVGRSLDVKARYRYALNGMAIWLTAEEAARVADLPGVISVTPNIPQPVDTDASPRWIGAPAVWSGTALGSEVGTMGEGIVVGVIDTGINIDHPSFAEVDKNGYEHLNPRGHYFGFCDPSNPHYDAKWKCNQKLIGLYSFIDAGSNAWDPEDDNGHGSHTASTAAGNFVTAPYVAPTTTLELEVSGVAPHANIVAYDACYSTPNGLGTCPPASTLAALDQALADQVDVINYSISTSQASPWQDPHQLAFRALRAAGIFAAVSAGNSGPYASTVAAISPWVTSVAATTSDRVFVNGLISMSGGSSAPPERLNGQSLTAGYGPAAIVWAGDGRFENVTGAADDGTCSQAFPAGTFDGQIVVCDRVGNTARQQRAANVRAGGAGGFVLANSQAQGDSLAADPYVLPAVHITYADGVALKAWLAAGSGQTATIAGSSVEYTAAVADHMAGFSSRGPAVSDYCCRRPDLAVSYADYFPVVKPDLGAPGAEVIAAVASGGGVPAPEFAAYGGTSMSSPHVAGAAALVMAARPGWTVAEVQSALMSTAVTETMVNETGTAPANAFDIGAGRIDVAKAVNAGVLLDVTMPEYDTADPALGGDPGALNLASMLDAECLDTCTWTRTLKSSLAVPTTWTASGTLDSGGSGLAVTVSPRTFTLAPGAEQEIEITADVRSAPRGDWVFGSVTLTPGGSSASTARMPVAVMPVPSTIPDLVPVYTLQASGSHTLPGVRAMDITDLQVDVSGLAQGRQVELSLAQDPNPGDRFTITEGKAVVTMTVPANATRILAEVYESTSKDIDILMGMDANGDGLPQPGEVLAYSFGETYVEYCEVIAAGVPASTFWVIVQNFKASDNAPDVVKLVTAAVPDADAGNLTVTAPKSTAFGQPFDLVFSWQLPGMQPEDRWYGLVQLGSSAMTPNDLGLYLVDVVGREAPTPTPTPPPPTATPQPEWPHKLFLPKTYREANQPPTPTAEPPTAEPTSEGPTSEPSEEPTGPVETPSVEPPTAEPPTAEPTAEPTSPVAPVAAGVTDARSR